MQGQTKKRRCAGLLALLLMGGAATAAEPVDLLEICNDALNLNPRYAAARAEYLAARELVPIAQGKLLPQIGLSGEANYISHRVQGDFFGLIDVDRDDDYESYQYGAVLEQALFRADLFLGKTQAEVRVRAASYVLEAAQDALLIDVAEAYFAVLAAYDAQTSAEAEARSFGEQVEMLGSRVDAGLTTEAELKAAQARHELALADRLEAENAIMTTTARLESLTGKRYPRLKRLPEDLRLLPPQPQDEQVWISRAEAANAAVLAQRALAEAAKLDHERALKTAWPRVSLNGLLVRLDNGGGVNGERDDQYDRVGVSVEVPIYSGGQISAAQRQTKELENRAVALVEEASAKAVRDARLAYLNNLSGLQRVDALNRVVEASRASEQAARAGYEAGTRSSTDLLQALDQRYRAERDYSLARYRALINSLRLKQQAGQLLTADIAQISRLLRAAPAQP